MTGQRALSTNRAKPMGHNSRCCYSISIIALPSTGKSRYDIYYLTSNGHSIAYAFSKKNFKFEHIIETKHLKKCNSNFNSDFYRHPYEFKVNFFLLTAPLRFLHHRLFNLIACGKNILLQGKRCRRKITICREVRQERCIYNFPA